MRLSGPKALAIGEAIIGFTPKPRHAHYCDFNDDQGQLLDSGLALYFANPHSFTGEDVFEFQGHGGPVVLDWLLARTLALGARLARPGEFSERAFLNDKIDLTQAEAIADLIDAASQSAARNALNSLQGQFKIQVQQLVEQLIALRIYVEAAIDFPEEEVDFLSDGKVAEQLSAVIEQTQRLLGKAQQGAIIREGLNLVIAGKPNAGKSSLLNALAERESAIVTDIAGTTRDILKEHIQIDGLAIHLTDTAGLRDTDDHVEKLGVDRARTAIAQAQQILVVIDAQRLTSASLNDQLAQELTDLAIDPSSSQMTLVINKIDVNPISSPSNWPETWHNHAMVVVSAKTGQGLDQLKQHIKSQAGLQSASEGQFTARTRHIHALQRALDYLHTGQQQIQHHQAGELLAEDLRLAQQCCDEITGQFTSDDLLGRIFSSFCIGK